MKFGFRVPSLRKRIATRTSVKRQLVHRLGFKGASRIWILREPKKAVYKASLTTAPLSIYSRNKETVQMNDVAELT